MQTDSGAGLLGDAAQLTDRPPRTPGHGQRQTTVGEHRPTGGVIDAFHQRHRAVRQTGVAECRVQCVSDDGLSGAQRIAANAQHGGVAGAQHTGGVGEHIRPAFEHKRDDAQRRHHLLDLPAVVLDATDDLAASRRRIAPGPQAGDHVAAHAFIGEQSRGGTPAGLGAFDVGQVGGLDQGPALGGFQALGKQIEERTDRLIRDAGQRTERRFGALDGDGGRLLVNHRDQQQLATDLLDQQMVPGLKARGQFGADDSDTITGKRDRRASD